MKIKNILFFGVGSLVILIGGIMLMSPKSKDTISDTLPNAPKIIKEELDEIYHQSSQENTNTPTSSTDKVDENMHNSDTSISQEEDEIDEETRKKREETQKQLDLLRKRFALQNTLAQGDEYMEGNLLDLALQEYLYAQTESPDDPTIVKKVANTSFLLKKYDLASKNYQSILDTLQKEELDTYIFSLLYQIKDNNPKVIELISQEIKGLPISQEEVFYYINALSCIDDFHLCKKSFETYFNEGHAMKYQPLLNIKKAIDNYHNFQVDELYYKDTLIISAFFQDEMYSISNILGRNILKDKPDYQPVLLMVGEGYYEIGNLARSKAYLEQYYFQNPKDVHIAYLLGDISFQLIDYENSNMYFNVALKNGFEPKTELQRRLAYNAYLEGDSRALISIFGFILQDPDATINDFSLGIYHAILQGREINARYWAEQGLELFDGQSGYEIFYGYLGWIWRESGDFEKAQEYLEKGLLINGKNPLILLNLGYLKELQEEYDVALIYFKRVISVNEQGEFGELAQKEIQQLEEYFRLKNKPSGGL